MMIKSIESIKQVPELFTVFGKAKVFYYCIVIKMCRLLPRCHSLTLESCHMGLVSSQRDAVKIYKRTKKTKVVKSWMKRPIPMSQVTTTLTVWLCDFHFHNFNFGMHAFAWIYHQVLPTIIMLDPKVHYFGPMSINQTVMAKTFLFLIIY